MRKINERGITLIALVVTIIVLIILAGVSINLVLGDNGIIIKAKDASKEQEIASIVEKIRLDIMEAQTTNQGNITEKELEIILKTKGTLSEEENILDKVLTTENGDEIKVSDIYNGELKEGITARVIENDISYIGKYVNYGGEETFKGVRWRIFNAENGQIQLIADDYIAFSELPTATNIAPGNYSSYCVYATDNRITLLNYINKTSNWNSFVAVEGATVTGAPTLEQFKNSYNRTHGESYEGTVKKIFTAKGVAMDDGLEGYYVGTSENPETIYIAGLNPTEMENLYVIDDDTNANSYWIGSPSARNDESVMLVSHGGNVDCLRYYNSIFGLRPLVSLPSGITLVEQVNGSYNVK